MPETTSGPETSRVRSELLAFVELFAVCGLAIAQPVLEIYGKNASGLLNRGVTGMSALLFALLVVFVPPVALWAITLPVRWLSPRAGRIVQLGLIGLLLGVLVAEIVGPSVLAWLLGGATVAGAVVVLSRYPFTRSWLRFVAAGPILFLVLFLFASSATPVIFPDDVETVDSRVGNPANIVFILFDELPTASLLDGNGQVDASRFPAFAELAQSSTWFRNYSSVAPNTDSAVPAILSGQLPEVTGYPPPAVASNYPDNLFTLLGESYDFNVHESISRLCPTEVCTRKDGQSLGGLLAEAGSYLIEGVIGADSNPDDGSELTTPGSGTQVAATEQEGATAGQEDPAAGHEGATAEQDLSGFDELIANDTRWHDPQHVVEQAETLRPSGGGRLDFFHFVLPHRPFELTPEGRNYAELDETRMRGVLLDKWASQYSADEALIRHLLQLQFTDNLLGLMIEELKEQGTWDDALIIVTADHGVGFIEHDSVRGVSETNAHQTLWTPLFIRGPGFTAGELTDRPASSTDLLPTIADVLQTQIPWPVAGTSLRAPAAGGEDIRFVLRNPLNELPIESDGFSRLAAKPQLDKLLATERVGTGDDRFSLFRSGPFADLINTTADTYPIAAGNGTYELDDAGTSREFDPSGGFESIAVSGTAWGIGDSGAPDGRAYVAVVVNGTIVRVLLTAASGVFFGTIPPGSMGAGDNTVSYFGLRGGPDNPVLVPLRDA